MELRRPRRLNPAVTHPITTAARDDLTPLLRNIWSATIRSLPAEDASRNRPNMIRIPMSVPAERTLERIVKYIIFVSFVTLSLLSQMGSITILFSSPNYRGSEGGKPPLHTYIQFLHPAVQYHTVRYHIPYGTLPIPYCTIPYTIWYFSLLFPMVFFPSFSTFILMFWLSLSSQLSLPGIYT